MQKAETILHRGARNKQFTFLTPLIPFSFCTAPASAAPAVSMVHFLAVEHVDLEKGG